MNDSVEKLLRAFGATVANVSFLKPFPIVICVLLLSSLSAAVQDEAGRHRLYGDLKLEKSRLGGDIPVGTNASFDVILYGLSGSTLGRQSVLNRGRYEFLNVPDGQYDLAIEFQNNEIGRLRVRIFAPFDTDVCQDIELEWDSVVTSRKPDTVSVEDFYERSAVNQREFEKAQHAIDKKKYAEATARLKRILADDPNDFQSWTELGTTYLAQGSWDEAEAAYVRATEVSPRFFQALLNLGRLRIMRKNFVGAIPVLLQALGTRQNSADANYYLGEAYLQLKEVSKAVTYFYEALRLDPIRKAQAHLRLAALYDAAGLKEKGAIEYQEFLKLVPDKKQL
jgi:tetratricopeptide (TPR) repeat protein